MADETIVVDYAEDQPIVSGGCADAATALRRSIGRIVVRNSRLAENHATIRDSVEEMSHCGYTVVVES